MINKALDWVAKNTGLELLVLHNVIIVKGVGGSGKTYAISRFALGDSKNVMVASVAKQVRDNLSKIFGIAEDSGKSKSIDELMQLILEGKKAEDVVTTHKSKMTNAAPVFTVKDGITFGKAPDGIKTVVIDEYTLTDNLRYAII